jgi:hypothetical protein
MKSAGPAIASPARVFDRAGYVRVTPNANAASGGIELPIAACSAELHHQPGHDLFSGEFGVIVDHGEAGRSDHSGRPFS